MKRLFIFLVFPVLLLAQNHLLITEVMIPSSTETEKTFIEIYNPTAASIDLDSVCLANYNAYYQMVNSEYSTSSSHFMASFPSAEIAAEQTISIALDGAGFFAVYGKRADYEIKGSDDDTPDMNILSYGANPQFEFTRGMAILFSWDGQSDLVRDIDYIPWGISAFSSYWMDKSGVQIDGPDEGTEVSAYADDKTKSQQQAWTAPGSGMSLQRSGITEIGETLSGGNGLYGHNEATENWKESFVSDNPSPGSFSANPGDGSGMASVDPDTLDAGQSTDLTFSFSGDADYVITSLTLNVPAGWQWSGSLNDVIMQGSAFSGAQLSINGSRIEISQAQLTDQQTGSMTISNLSAPQEAGRYPFEVQTAVQDGKLTPISVFPAVQLIKTLTIADIQDDLDTYDGTQVTIEAVVTIGVNITRTDRCDVYVQDGSGRGINLSDLSTDQPLLVRGNRLKITGTVSNYIDKNNDQTTQIENFTLQLIASNQDLPGVFKVSAATAGDISLEGTMIETAGIILDKAEGIGGGTNITISDGISSLTMRIWDSSGLNLSEFATGDTVGVRGIISSYMESPQLLIGYQEDIFKSTLLEVADGKGVVTVLPDSVGKGETVALDFSFDVEYGDTLAAVQICIPSYWGWTSDPLDVSGSGEFEAAQVDVQDEVLTLSNFILTNSTSSALTISNLTAPDADTASTFTIKTASPSGTLQDILSSPVVQVGKGTAISTISIAQARALAVGSSIVIKGVVTVGAGVLRNNYTDGYIQDASGYGLNIYRSGTLDPDIKRGNLVVMAGELEEYQGKMEIINYTATVIKKNSAIPAMKKMTTQQAYLDAPNGSFIEIQGIIEEKSSGGGGENITLNDGSGPVLVRAWETAGVNLDIYKKGDYVVIRGVMSSYNSTPQLLLAYQEDIFSPQFEASPTVLKVANRPFVPDRGETIDIEFSAGIPNSHYTLRIYDLGGRLITTLMDGAGLPVTVRKSWDGRDQLGQNVPLGSYICHLEIVDTNSGKRVIRMAPIVVGTVLK